METYFLHLKIKARPTLEVGCSANTLKMCSDKSEPTFYLPQRINHCEFLWLFLSEHWLQSKDRASLWVEDICEHRYPSSRTQVRADSDLGFPLQTLCGIDVIEPFPLVLEEDYGRLKYLHIAKQNFNLIMLRKNTGSNWRDCNVSGEYDMQLALGN